MLTRIDHIGIACFDLDKTVEFYSGTYGFEVYHSEVNEEQGVREAMLRINATDDGGASYLQLLEPTRPDSTVAKWLDKHGEGVHHIAFRVKDTKATEAALTGEGMPTLQQGLFIDGSGMYTYVDSAAQLGVMVELLENFPKKQLETVE